MTELHARHTMYEQKCLTVATELLFQNELRLAAQSQNYKIVEKKVVVFA